MSCIYIIYGLNHEIQNLPSKPELETSCQARALGSTHHSTTVVWTTWQHGISVRSATFPPVWGGKDGLGTFFLLKIIDESKNGIASATFGEGLYKTSQMSNFIPEQCELCSRKQQTSLVGSTNKDVSPTWYTRLDCIELETVTLLS